MMQSRSKVVSERKVRGDIRSLVNAMGLQIERAKGFA